MTYSYIISSENYFCARGYSRLSNARKVEFLARTVNSYIMKKKKQEEEEVRQKDIIYRDSSFSPVRRKVHATRRMHYLDTRRR